MRRIILTALVLLGLTSCNFIKFNGETCGNVLSAKETITASAKYVTETINTDIFERIHTQGAFDIEYTQGEQNVRIYAPDNVIPHIIAEVSDGTLKLSTARTRIRKLGKVKIYVSSPKLNGVQISGSGDFEAENGMVADNLDIRVSGSGDINIEGLTAGDIEIHVSGAGDIDIDRLDCNSINAKISGAGDVELSGKANTADLRISGAGDIDVSKLNCPEISSSISGAGNVKK